MGPHTTPNTLNHWLAIISHTLSTLSLSLSEEEVEEADASLLVATQLEKGGAAGRTVLIQLGDRRGAGVDETAGPCAWESRRVVIQFNQITQSRGSTQQLRGAKTTTKDEKNRALHCKRERELTWFQKKVQLQLPLSNQKVHLSKPLTMYVYNSNTQYTTA